MGSPAITAAGVARQLEAVRARIAAVGRDPSDITVIAVTKGFGPEAIVAAVGAGLVEVGENYAQECVAKIPAARDQLAGSVGVGGVGGVGVGSVGGVTVAPRLHFIGRLQTNKVRLLSPHVALWQSVDRLPLGREIARRAAGARVLVQVNVSDEPAKGGCAPGGVGELVGALLALGLDVCGLMAVGPTGPPDMARPGFAWVRAECDRLGLAVCSMGMTDDLEIAVAEGSTMVRVGSALFGMRPSPPPAELA